MAALTEISAQVSSLNGSSGNVTVKPILNGNNLSISGGNTLTLPYGRGNISSLMDGTGISAVENSGTVTISAGNADAIWNAGKLFNTPVTGAPQQGQTLKFNGNEWAPAADETGGGLQSIWIPVDLNYCTDNVSISIGTTASSALLTVDGTIHAQELIVKIDTEVPDYVFNKDYKLRSLQEVNEFIKTNKHLPEIPSAEETESENIQLAEMNMLLLKKVEELTLYVIQNEKKLKELEMQFLDN